MPVVEVSVRTNTDPVKYLSFKFVFLLVSLLTTDIYGQRSQIITLSNEKLSIDGRDFFIEKVIDNRYYKDNIGLIRVGIFNAERQAILSKGLQTSFEKYFDYSIPRSGDMRAIEVKVNHFNISEKTYGTNEYAIAELSMAFF